MIQAQVNPTLKEFLSLDKRGKEQHSHPQDSGMGVSVSQTLPDISIGFHALQRLCRIDERIVRARMGMEDKHQGNKAF